MNYSWQGSWWRCSVQLSYGLPPSVFGCFSLQTELYRPLVLEWVPEWLSLSPHNSGLLSAAYQLDPFWNSCHCFASCLEYLQSLLELYGQFEISGWWMELTHCLFPSGHRQLCLFTCGRDWWICPSWFSPSVVFHPCSPHSFYCSWFLKTSWVFQIWLVCPGAASSFARQAHPQEYKSW